MTKVETYENYADVHDDHMSNNAVWLGSFKPESARADFQSAFEHLSFEGRSKVGLQSINSIVIKINICDYRSSESGATTDPYLLAALIDFLHGKYPSANIYIIENDATSVDIRSAYRILGFEEIAKKHNAKLCNVSDGQWIKKRVPNGLVLQELEIPEMVETADIFINFAKLKTNGLTKLTGCLKNIYGLLRIKRKVVYHNRIDQILYDMNQVIKPDICLVDGYIAMEGMGGPSFGHPKRCELLVAGTNPVSVDACCARVMGFDPLTVKHVKLCHQGKLGTVQYALSTNIQGFDYSRYKFRFELWEYWLKNVIRSRAGFST